MLRVTSMIPSRSGACRGPASCWPVTASRRASVGVIARSAVTPAPSEADFEVDQVRVPARPLDLSITVGHREHPRLGQGAPGFELLPDLGGVVDAEDDQVAVAA